MKAESSPQPIAVVRDYDGLRAALIARRVELRLSLEELDAISGVADRYSGKVLLGTRCFGDMSLQAILGALRLELVVRPYCSPKRRVA